MEKMIIVDLLFGGKTTITTIDSGDKNRIKEYKLDVYSLTELSERIVKRVKDEGFNRVLVSSHGIGISLNDTLINEFKQEGYTYNPKNGTVIKNSIEFKNDGSTFIIGNLISSDLEKQDEF